MIGPAGQRGAGGPEPVRPWYRPRLDGLAPRVAAYLSLALLPLGLIALYQTREYQEETEERAELSLLALTEQGAAGVGTAIERAIGAGQALQAAAGLLGDPAACADVLGRLVGDAMPFDFVGFLPPEGLVTCSSVGEPLELEPEVRAEVAALLANPRVEVRASEAQMDSLVVGMPVETPEGQQGFLTFTIPRARVQEPIFGPSSLEPLRLLTFNDEGEVLTGAAPVEGSAALASLLPAEGTLASRAQGRPLAFIAPSAGGPELAYTVAPLVPGVAYAMAIWTPEQAGQGVGRLGEAPILFPLLMWAASLAVAFWAINRLVIRRVTDLGGRMRRFGRDRSLLQRPTSVGTPFELREIEDSFRHMADSILQDEARMEHAFRERGVLLREVHHRVKNNLQLISSIISMQVRRMPEPRVRQILRRLQDRVLTLASIYRSLYTSPDMGDVNAAPVIRAIVEQELRAAEGRVVATLDIEDMVLDPDKVVPLSFLAAEAVSNALARARSEDGKPSLSVTLHRDDGHATLSIANSLAGVPDAAEAGQGLGQHLIQAFAAQVGGPVEVQAGDRLYRLCVTFPTETEEAQTVPA